MKLVERDLIFLLDLYYIKYINSKRVANLFGNYNSAMRRLRILQKEGLIQNIDFLLNGEKVYCLTKKGFGKICKDNYSINKTDKINHFLVCADFYFYLKSQGYNIEYFELDEQIKYKYQGKSYKFRPDVILKLDRWYLVEIDLSNKRFEEKVRKWENYYHSMMFKKRFELFPPIFIVSNNVKKVSEIINKCKTIELNYAYKDLKDIVNNDYCY